MVAYSKRKFRSEIQLRRNLINIDYPILFNRINWNMIEENIDDLCEFQRNCDDILPPMLFYATRLWTKIYSVITEDPEKMSKALKLRHSNKHTSYDYIYEFIQKYPEWSKLVYYDENPADIYDEFLTIHIDKTLPLEFNRINWKKVDQKIDKIYEIMINQERKTVPSILYMRSGKGLSEHYKIISLKMWEYYDEEYFTKSNPIFAEYENNSNFDNYDGFYYFIKDYPELSDIVYFDPDK